MSFKVCSLFMVSIQMLVSTQAQCPFGPGPVDPCAVDCIPPPTIVPLPQPVPIRVPCPQRPQSVTIPNIIVALLPPNQKPVVPRPVIRPPPVVLPLPQPAPLPFASGFGNVGFPGCGNIGLPGCGNVRFSGCDC